MAVNKKDFQAYERALLDSFPNCDDLQRMVYYVLGVELEEVVGRGALRDVVFKLLRWADSEGRLSELMVGARQRNPGNDLLRRAVLRIQQQKQQLNDAGTGAEIAGDVHVSGGTFVGRDQINIHIHPSLREMNRGDEIDSAPDEA